MEYKQIRVLITGLGSGSHGLQILKALRLSNLPYYCIGTDMQKASYGLSFTDKSYMVPSAQHPDYISTIVAIAEKNDIKAIFHGSEPELKVLSKNRKVFSDMGILLPINPPEVIDLCMNKYETMRFLKSKHFYTPETFFIASKEDINSVDVYPVVCKPHVGGGASNNVFIAQNKRELELLSEYLLGYLQGFIAQEYVGVPEGEYTVGVLTDFEGTLIGSIVVKRYVFSGLNTKIRIVNRTERKELGKYLVISSGVSQGEVGSFRNIAEYCERVALTLGARGPINFQCRFFDNKVYIFEINPRFSGTTSLRAMVGFNEPDILIRKYILKEKLGPISYREGVILRGVEEISMEQDINEISF